jgi:uncharacterized protein YacL
MPNLLLCSALTTSCLFFSGLIGYYIYGDFFGILTSSIAGAVLGLTGCFLLKIWLKKGAYEIAGAAAGAIAGAFLGILINSGLAPAILRPELQGPVSALLVVSLALIGIQLGASKAPEMRKDETEVEHKEPRTVGILDTSVIIDGRVADVCETGFLSGDLIIPQFVLRELQMIADSPEATKRTRGRRGLDILNKMRKQSYVNVIIIDVEYPSVKDVDQKLITMAKETGYAILTNDFNLNKVAEVHAIQVLNMNQLANALKPIVLPGENMKVQVIKEGKEPTQGVAYLDDGTMVVIDNGRKYMGRNVEATVTSVLQTPAGRMIFAVMKNS